MGGKGVAREAGWWQGVARAAGWWQGVARPSGWWQGWRGQLLADGSARSWKQAASRTSGGSRLRDHLVASPPGGRRRRAFCFLVAGRTLEVRLPPERKNTLGID
jgi:hypothetical protein